MDTAFSLIYAAMDRMLPFSWAEPLFMKRALLGLVLLAPMSAAMGVQVVNFRMAFFSDAISHSAFTGIALGLIAGVDPRLSLVVFGVLVGLAIVAVKRTSELSIDAVVGVFLATVVALGIAIISARKGLTRTLNSFLYGDILTIDEGEILLTLALFCAVMLFMALSYNRLLFMGLDHRLAHAHGVPVVWYEYAHTALLALVVSFQVRAIGLLLVTAMLVVPAAAGRNMARSAGGMFWWAQAVAMFSAVAGLVASTSWDSATGATVILFAAGAFVLSTFFARVIKT